MRNRASSEAASLSVSVAIATYQGARYLKEQLDSIAKQTILPIEVVITDDCSTDGTLKVAESFGRNAPFPIRTYPNEQRLRYGDNFLRAASLCQGDLIAYCDQDDIWLEQKIEVCLQYFRDREVQLVCHSAQTFTGNQQLGYLFPHIKRTQLLSQGSCDQFENLPGFVMMFRRELLYLIPFEDRTSRLYGHDHWAYFLATSVGSVVKISDVLCLYRQHASNVYGAHRHSVSRKMQLAAEIPGYTTLARAESEGAQLLTAWLDSFPSQWQASVELSADRLVRRSKLHRLRALLYTFERRSFLSRLSTFTRLCFLGAYFPDRSRSRLGPKAAMKDLLIGVFGLRRRPPSTQA